MGTAGMRRMLWCGLLVAVLVYAGVAVCAQEPDPRTLILDTSSFWRCHYTLRPAVVREAGGQVKPVTFSAKWLNHDTACPPADWREPEFDDSSWPRVAGVFTRVARRGVGPKSPLTALACRRGKFTVTDPTRVAGLSLSLTYQGGVVVTLNGTEVARGHLPAGPITPDTLADDYPLEAQVKPDGSTLILTDWSPPEEELRRMKLRERSLEDVKVPVGLLRKGVNVLAVELHRAPFHPKTVGREGQGGVVIGWGTCGLLDVRLTAPGPDPASGAGGIVPNVARPTGLQVWNSDVVACDFDQDYGDPNETLRPMRIVAARGGAFSAKVVVGSDAPIRGLRGVMSDLVHEKGPGVIGAVSVEVRYALPWGYEHGSGGRYPLPVGRFDLLSPTPPDEIEVRVKEPASRRQKLEDIVPRPVFGAICPVWVTVHVPRDARPGDYAGTLTLVTSTGVAARVPVKLQVASFVLPPPRDFRTFAEFIQSPDSLSLAFDTPLWSPEHWRHVEESLRLLGQLGNKTCYIPLISETNLGNAESMVRWTSLPDGTWAYDFSVMDRYLDLVEKHQGRPAMVCLVVWDVFLEGGRYTGQERYVPKDVQADRESHAGVGPEVTLVDPAAGKTSKRTLPQQSEAESRALWKPLIDEVMRRLERRGLRDVAMFGLCTDTAPTKEIVALYKELAPAVPWMNQAHGERGKLYDVPVAYNAHVWGARFALDPTQGRSHGWRQERLIVFFPRSSFDPFPMVTHRLMAETNIAGEERGFGRLGGDTWHVVKDARGRPTARVTEGRFPRSSWRALNIISAYLGPGTDGPVATARFEMVREGIQECEARIVIEEALLDETKRKRLGDLATRAQAVLDARTRDMLRGMNALSLGPHFTSNAENRHLWWERPAVLGAYGFIHSEWQRRSGDLFTAAAEIARISGSDRPQITDGTVRQTGN